MKKLLVFLIFFILNQSNLFSMQKPEDLKVIDKNLELTSKDMAQKEPDFGWIPEKINILTQSLDLNSADDLGNTRLHYAAFLKNLQVINLLLYLGASPATANAHGQDFLAILELLINREKDPYIKNQLIAGYKELLGIIANKNTYQLFPDGSTLLHKAVLIQDAGLVAWLLASNMINPNQRNATGNTPLHFALAYYSDNPTILNQLLAYRANPNIQTELGNTPLHAAAKDFTGNAVAINQLLQYGASPDIQNNNWDTPLHSMLNTLSDVIKEYTDPEKNKSRTQQQKNEKFDVAKKTALAFFQLMQYSKSKNIQDNFGNSPLYHLMLLSDSSEPEVTTLLRPLIETIFLDRQANPNIQNRDGFTPLHAATSQKDPELVKLLLEHGANPHIRSYINPRTIAQVRSGLVPPPNKSPREMAQEIKQGLPENQQASIVQIENALLSAEQQMPAPAQQQTQVPIKLKPVLQKPSPFQQKKGASALETALRDLAISLQELRKNLS